MQRKMRLKAALIAVISALPFMSLASWFWIGGQKPSVFSAALYNMGDAIFQLGFPLTTILYAVLLNLLGGRLTQESDFWTLPLINIVFLSQWIIWSQWIVFFKINKIK